MKSKVEMCMPLYGVQKISDNTPNESQEQQVCYVSYWQAGMGAALIATQQALNMRYLLVIYLVCQVCSIKKIICYTWDFVFSSSVISLEYKYADLRKLRLLL